MSSSAKIENMATVVLRIPNISNLLVFKECLSNKNATVELIKELVKMDHPEPVYFGYDFCQSHEKEALEKKPDSAIVCINFVNKKIIRRDFQKTLSVLKAEIQRPCNIFNVDNDMFNLEKDITTVAIVVRSSRCRKTRI